MSTPKDIVGKYRHYKGGEYEVISEALHSETEEPVIVYRSLVAPFTVWVRPHDMFFESVVVDGVERPRFARMEAA